MADSPRPMELVPSGITSPGFSVLLFAGLLGLTLLPGMVAALLPPALRGPHTPYVTALQPHWVDRFFQWDARWYGKVATEGYGWTPAQAVHEQTVAFFPLWPVVLRAIAACGLPTEAQRWLVVVLTAGLTLASIHVFQRLALLLLPLRPARLASAFYAFWPASLFLLQSYPAGLINLLTILGLSCILRGRLVAAATCSALATAGGPLSVALAVTVGVSLAHRAHIRSAARLPAFLIGLLRATPLALLSVAGLLAFMAWQAVRFGDPLAFIEAQRGWETAAPPDGHVARFVLMSLVLPELAQASASLIAGARSIRAHLISDAQEQLENAINLLGLAGAILVLPILRRLGQPMLTLQAALTLALYIWFVAAEHGGWATLRLIYPAPGLFLALGWGLPERPRVFTAALTCSSLLLALHAFLINAGYGVI